MWFVLALGSALFFALQSAAAKQHGVRVHGDVVAWTAFAFALPAYAVALLLVGVPDVEPGFWGWLLTSFGLNLVAMPLYFGALASGSLSIVLPLASLSPLFALGTEYLLLGEVPAPLAWVGVPLLVAGSYLLHAPSLRHGPLEPLRRLLADPAARKAIATAALWSVTAVADRGAVLRSSPTFYLAVFSLSYTVVLLPWLLLRRRAALSTALRHPLLSASVGLSGATMALCQMSALAIAPAALVIAVKRLAGLFGVLFGGLWFRETEMAVRLGAALLMVAGAGILAFA